MFTTESVDVRLKWLSSRFESTDPLKTKLKFQLARVCEEHFPFEEDLPDATMSCDGSFSDVVSKAASEGSEA